MPLFTVWQCIPRSVVGPFTNLQCGGCGVGDVVSIPGLGDVFFLSSRHDVLSPFFAMSLPQEPRLVTASYSGRLQLWDYQSHQLLTSQKFKVCFVFMGHVMWSQGGKRSKSDILLVDCF